MRALCLSLLAVLGAAEFALGQTSVGTPARRVRSGTQSRPVYSGDVRMNEVATRKPTACRLTRLLEELGIEHRVVLLAEPRLRTHPVLVAGGPQPLGKLMGQLAALLTAQWYQVGDRYVLARDAHLAVASALTRGEADALLAHAALGILDRLTPTQWERLEEGGILSYQDLTPEQQADAGEFAAAAEVRGNTPWEADRASRATLFVHLSRFPDGKRELDFQLLGPYGSADSAGIELDGRRARRR
jgi:hypothetical protein